MILLRNLHVCQLDLVDGSTEGKRGMGTNKFDTKGGQENRAKGESHAEWTREPTSPPPPNPLSAAWTLLWRREQCGKHDVDTVWEQGDKQHNCEYQ